MQYMLIMLTIVIYGVTKVLLNSVYYSKVKTIFFVIYFVVEISLCLLKWQTSRNLEVMCILKKL